MMVRNFSQSDVLVFYTNLVFNKNILFLTSMIYKISLMINRIVLIITFLLIADNISAQHTYGSRYFGDSYVNYILSGNKTEAATIVMIPGLNLSSYIFSTTPDGRDGWAEMFADKGYNVFMVNDPKFDFATGGFVSPYTIPSGGKAATTGAVQAWQSDIWERWGFGTSQGNPYPNAKFPTNSFAEFAKNYPYLGTSSQRYEAAIEAVIDYIGGKVWIVAHSAGTQSAVLAAIQKKTQTNGLILIEPAGPPDSSDFPALNGLHMFGVYGDYIISRNQTSRKQATEAAAVLFQNAGGIADVVSLPDDFSVFGNSHIMMQDLNNNYVFNVIDNWLKQFSSKTLGVESYLENEIRIDLYPNPTTSNEVRINSNSLNNLKYSIFSIDGRLYKESTISNQKIDLSGTPNGLLLVKFTYKDQIILKKIIKKGL
jgi:pimeloyl-ACP methyl ester carboxylesterase